MSCKNCGNSPINVPAGSRPYYEEVTREVTQAHETVYSSTVHAVSIQSPDTWNVPVIGEDISVLFPQVSVLPVGSYLYSPIYGYFRISHWNPRNQTAGLRNEGIPGTAAPGTAVPAAALFITAPRPCCQDDNASLFPFLAANFTAQDVGLQRSVSTTSTFGLRTGELIRIGEGVYRLITINSSREIVILNEGAGYGVGQTVYALDAVGDYQYLITEENTSACSATTVYEAKLVTCVGADEKILRGELPGQVPVLQDEVLGNTRYKFLDSSVRKCAKLTAQVIITTGTSTYTIVVNDATPFLANDYVVFMTDTNNMRFRISSIAGNSVTIIRTADSPVANFTGPVDTIICKEESTVTLRKDLTTLEGQVGAVSSVPTGVVNPFVGSSAPSGWILAGGGTIGNAASGASVRANADTEALFLLLWNSMADAQAPVIGGRGASAAADFAANKRITIPDLRQRFILGLASAGTGSVMGGIGGAIDHDHSVPAHFHGIGTGADLNITSSGTHTTTINIGHTHNNAALTTGGTSVTIDGATASITLSDPGHSHGGRTRSIGEDATFSTTHSHSMASSGSHDHDLRQEAGGGGTSVGSAANIISLVASTATAYQNSNNHYTGGAHSHAIDATSTDHWHTIPSGSTGITLSQSNHSHTNTAHTHTIPNMTLAATNVTDTSGVHVHAVSSFSGRIGLVTGGVDGNSAMVTGATNPPFIALRHIIKL